jgi:Oxidoreductase family, NAD-binding Rossmann fold
MACLDFSARPAAQNGGCREAHDNVKPMATSLHPLRVLVARAGAFGREHLSRLTKRPDAKVVGVADADPLALEAVRAGLGGAECLTDPLRMIDSVEADAIIIATPAASHVEIAVRALGGNLAVLLEKPVAPSASAALRLLAAATPPRASSCPATCCGSLGITTGWSKLCARGGLANLSI